MSFENEHVHFWSRFLIAIGGSAYLSYILVFVTQSVIFLTYNGVLLLLLILFITSCAWTGVVRSVIEDIIVRRAVFDAKPEDFMTGGEAPW